jgi:pimeloyl-ACP methyl ester carboxylesterase
VQALQHLTPAAACLHNQQHGAPASSAFSHCFATSTPAAQQAQVDAPQQQQSQQKQPLFASSMSDPAVLQQTPTSNSPALLAFDEVYVDASTLRASSSPPSTAAMQAANPITAVFLHGLLGSARNWRSFSRKLAVDAAAKANRDVRVLLLDLRCHGDSAGRFGFHPPHDMTSAAADVAAVIQHELQGRSPHLLVGLSLGGKIALQVRAQDRGEVAG